VYYIMKTRRNLRRGGHTKKKRKASRVMNKSRKEKRIHKRWKGGDEDLKLIFLEQNDIDDLNKLFKYNGLEQLSTEFKPLKHFGGTFIQILTGEEQIDEDTRNKIFYQFRSYLLSALYSLKNSTTTNLLDIMEEQKFIRLCERLVQRIDMYSPTVELFEVLGRWKRWLFSLDMPELYSFPADDPGKSGVSVRMDVYPDLSDPAMIGKSKEDINKNSSKILDFKYRIYGDDPVKNAEHALNLIFFSPYLLETNGEDYVDFLTRPITSQHGEVLYSRPLYEGSEQDASNKDASNKNAYNKNAYNKDASNKNASNKDASNKDAF
jgi:hypothetical protein